ncbi:MAG: NAD(P)-binding oxidoreductase [Candidatus Sumerlaeia bacterium]|nr:NAD(P)-binding oxidoreductase [Candidatus Sumerlaeia bacterium]
MNVLVLGATGKVGRLTVEHALKNGHQVVALARRPESLKSLADDHGNKLRLVEGDVTNGPVVRDAMKDTDGIIATFGAPLNWQTLTTVPTVRTDGAVAFLNAMNHHQIKRIVLLSGIGVGNTLPGGRPIFRYVIRPLLLGRIYRDMARQEELLRETTTDWTIVRAAELTDADSEAAPRIISEGAGESASFITRRAVARFLVESLVRKDLIKKQFVLSH